MITSIVTYNGKVKKEGKQIVTTENRILEKEEMKLELVNRYLDLERGTRLTRKQCFMNESEKLYLSPEWCKLIYSINASSKKQRRSFVLLMLVLTTQSVNNATNCCSFFFTLSLSTQHVSALNGHLQVSYYAKTATLTYLLTYSWS
jgi:hypothetical protein